MADEASAAVDADVATLLGHVRRLAAAHGGAYVTFGELFQDAQVEQQLESLVSLGSPSPLPLP